MVLPLAKKGSDHLPFVVHICIDIPKAKIFRFENYWVDLPGFKECVTQSWERGSAKAYSSAVIADKLKGLRHELKKWHLSLARLKGLIQNCNKVIVILDTLEEERPLYREEFNFRQIVKLHLEDFLLAECNYWKKRCTIRWIKQGEDNTRFFHAMATERFRRNNIAVLHDVDGNEVTDHHAMASLLWEEYKNMMGRSDGITMEFNLHSLIKRVDGLDELTVPFQEKEMDEVVNEMPIDRALGPDGFNGLFLKKCWPIIKKDFYKLAKDFHKGTIKLPNINGSYITLVPKKQVSLTVNDFRPISLTNVCVKFLT
jgi:mannosylglycoprotein endo-beta-mannosidase